LLMRTLGPSLGRLAGKRGAVALAVLFGLNIPACAAPLLFAILGSAAVGGAGGLAQMARGFVSLAVFGLALSLPLVLAMLWKPARRALDQLATWSSRAPLWIGLLLVALGAWSIYFAVFVKPRP
jgi:cytochrome c-type biogenesis protein